MKTLLFALTLAASATQAPELQASFDAVRDILVDVLPRCSVRWE